MSTLTTQYATIDRVVEMIKAAGLEKSASTQEINNQEWDIYINPDKGVGRRGPFPPAVVFVGKSGELIGLTHVRKEIDLDNALTTILESFESKEKAKSAYCGHYKGTGLAVGCISLLAYPNLLIAATAGGLAILGKYLLDRYAIAPKFEELHQEYLKYSNIVVGDQVYCFLIPKQVRTPRNQTKG